MAASFVVELQKMARRPATWTVGLGLVALVAIFGYVLFYVFTAGVVGDPSARTSETLPSFYPEYFPPTVLGALNGLGGALALVLGALAVGSEYGWGTFKLVLAQRPGRSSYFSGKLLSLGVVMAFLTLLAFAVGALCSYVIATLQSGAVDWPLPGEILRAVGAGWLILATFAAMGAFLATLLRGSALAIGLGLVYLLVVEDLLSVAAIGSETVDAATKVLPGSNALDLVASFTGSRLGAAAAATPPGLESVSAVQAALVLGAYLAAFAGLSTLLFGRRDLS